MNVMPINQSVAERHVQFSEFVAVEIPPRTETQMVTIVEPTVYSQRLERAMRTAPTVAPAQPENAPSQPVKAYKNACEKAALVCGALAIPSFALVVMGPIWLVAPAALIAATVAFSLLRGKPTQEILQERAQRATDAKLHDSQS